MTVIFRGSIRRVAESLLLDNLIARFAGRYEKLISSGTCRPTSHRERLGESAAPINKRRFVRVTEFGNRTFSPPHLLGVCRLIIWIHCERFFLDLAHVEIVREKMSEKHSKVRTLRDARETRHSTLASFPLSPRFPNDSGNVPQCGL